MHNKAEKDYLECVTLGKQHTFYWKMDNENQLTILRNFSSGQSIKTITSEELQKIIHYPENGWKGLRNRVDGYNHTGNNDGLGPFLRRELHWTTTECQLAGHLGSLFSKAGIWNWNGQRMNQMFLYNSENKDPIKSLIQLYNSK
jgi:hypothetical protein